MRDDGTPAGALRPDRRNPRQALASAAVQVEGAACRRRCGWAVPAWMPEYLVIPARLDHETNDCEQLRAMPVVGHG